MRKYLLFALVLISTQTFSQTSNPDLDKFTGTWRWGSGNDSVILVLAKQISTFPNGENHEVLVGWHKYIKNGQLIESSMQHIGQNINDENIPLGNDLQITLYGFTMTPNKIWFNRFFDLTLHKKCHVFFELQPGSLTQANWKLTNPNGTKYMGPAGTYAQFTLLRDLVLTKQ